MGNAYKTTLATGDVTVAAAGAGKNAAYKGQAGADESENKLEEGVVYFTIDTNKTNAKGEDVEFANGDAVDVTVIITKNKQKFVQTAATVNDDKFDYFALLISLSRPLTSQPKPLTSAHQSQTSPKLGFKA